MSGRVPVAALERRPLPGVDPARAWAYLADFRTLPEWSGATAVDWPDRMPEVGDEVVTVQRLGVLRYRLAAEVAAWEAGRAFRLDLAGLPAALDAELTCRLDAYVEQGRPVAAVELRFRATARRGLAPVVQWRAARRLRRALARLDGNLARIAGEGVP